METGEQMTVNASGGKQHFIPYRAQALFFKAIKAVAALRYEGFNKHGYEDENYKQIPIEEHLNHCLIHIINAVTGEDERGRSVKDNWIHALCRLMMIVEIILDEESDDSQINAGEINYCDIVDTVRKEYGFDVTFNRKKG